MYKKLKIQFLLVVLAFVMIFGNFTLVASSNSEEGHERAVNMEDVFRLRQYLAGYDVDIDMEMADVNKDGVVDYNDVLALRQYLAGFPVDFPPPGSLLLPADYMGVFYREAHPMMINPVLEVKVSQNLVSPGEYVYVEIYMGVNPGLAVLDFTMAYDSRLEVSQIQRHADFLSTFNMNPIIYPFPNPLRFGMESMNLQNVNATGTLLRILFRVRGDANPGNGDAQLAHFTLDSIVFADDVRTRFMPILEDNYIRVVSINRNIISIVANGTPGIANTTQITLTFDGAVSAEIDASNIEIINTTAGDRGVTVGSVSVPGGNYAQRIVNITGDWIQGDVVEAAISGVVGYNITGTESTMLNRFDVPPTGIADITGLMVGMFGFLAVSAVLWVYLLSNKLRRNNG